MGLNIQAKNDYSTLFSSINRDKSGMASFNFSDYNSIKNGSYGKLLKAYYKKDATDTSTSKVSSKNKDVVNKATDSTAKSGVNSKAAADKGSELLTVASSADALATSVGKLMDKSSNSIFSEKEMVSKDANGTVTSTKGYDREAISKGVNDFVSQYNSFIKKSGDTSNINVNMESDRLKNTVKAFSGQLNAVGISVEKDGSLKVNEDTLNNADVSKVKNLFSGNQSFGYAVSSKASMIGNTAETTANTMKNYTQSGNYADSYSVGNLLSGMI